MKIYSFWSGDTTYFTKSSSLKKAQKIGKENMLHYIETCKYLGDKPEAEENYFIPEEVEKVTKWNSKTGWQPTAGRRRKNGKKLD